MHWSTSHEDKEDPEDGARAEAEAAQEEEEDTVPDPDQDQDPPRGTETMATAAETDTATAIQTLNKAREGQETEDEEGNMTMKDITRTKTNKLYSYKGSK